MKKIGLVCVNNNNYGSILQSFALQYILKKLGNDVTVIRYEEKSLMQKLHRMRSKEWTINKWNYIKNYYIIPIWNKSLRNGLKLRNERFYKFKVEKFIYSNIYTDLNDISEFVKTMDVIVLGSDQVWHPSNLEMNYFTLNFVPINIKKNSYAPSFGVSNLTNIQAKKTIDFLKRFDAISVRELSGKKIIKDLIGKDVEIVCDPTLLLSSDEWNGVLNVSKPLVNNKYILCYFIGDNPWQRKNAEAISKKFGLKIIALPHIDKYVHSDESYADIKYYDAGPIEFINLIKHASLVMTDSFHATVFSIINHTPFFTFNRFKTGNKASTNSRISSILKILDLEERHIKSEVDLNITDNNIMCDFSNTDKVLEKFRVSSLKYLKESING